MIDIHIMEHILRYVGQIKTSLMLSKASYREEGKVGKMVTPDFQKFNILEECLNSVHTVDFTIIIY